MREFWKGVRVLGPVTASKSAALHHSFDFDAVRLELRCGLEQISRVYPMPVAPLAFAQPGNVKGSDCRVNIVHESLFFGGRHASRLSKPYRSEETCPRRLAKFRMVAEKKSVTRQLGFAQAACCLSET